MLGVDQYFTVRRHDIVRLFFSFKTMSSQNIRYTSFMPASENNHSVFRIYSLSLPTGALAVIEGGVYKSSLFIFHRELYLIFSDLSLGSWI